MDKEWQLSLQEWSTGTASRWLWAVQPRRHASLPNPHRRAAGVSAGVLEHARPRRRPDIAIAGAGWAAAADDTAERCSGRAAHTCVGQWRAAKCRAGATYRGTGTVVANG